MGTPTARTPTGSEYAETVRSNHCKLWGRGSLVVKVTESWSACHEFEPFTAKDPPCRGTMPFKSVEVQRSSHSCGVKIRRGVLAQVSSSSLDDSSNYEVCRQKPWNS
ncbi:hypothetical protein TNCV_3322041 [Trichonephila clavipes]|nr:hypothetical protein TNCV_3322041 [Trichonephila clavipes]